MFSKQSRVERFQIPRVEAAQLRHRTLPGQGPDFNSNERVTQLTLCGENKGIFE